MKTIVLGAGFTGLVAAQELAQKGAEVLVLERAKSSGGLAGAFNLGTTRLDHYYRHIFVTDYDILALIKKYSLPLNWHESKMGYYFNNKLYDFGKPQDLLKFDPLKLLDRLRFGLGILSMKYKINYSDIEQMSAEEYIKKIFGQNVFEVVWKPLLLAKFGDNYKKIGAVWFWGKIALRSRTRNYSGNKEKLGYMPGGFINLIEKIEHECKKNNVQIRNSCEVKEFFKRDDGKFVVKYLNNSVLNEEIADCVLSCLPLPVFVNVAKQLSDIEIDDLKKIDFMSASVMILQLKSPFTHLYWMNVADNEIPFGGLIEHTNLVSASQYQNKHLLYISHYVNNCHDIIGKNSDYLLEYYLPHLKKISLKFSSDDILDMNIIQAKHAQPIITTNYSKIKPGFTTSLNGVYHASMVHIYPEDRGMNYAIKIGKAVGLQILQERGFLIN